VAGVVDFDGAPGVGAGADATAVDLDDLDSTNVSAWYTPAKQLSDKNATRKAAGVRHDSPPHSRQ